MSAQMLIQYPKLKVQFAIAIFVIGYLLFAIPKAAWAQVVSLSPEEATKTVGEEFTVDLNINTNGKAVSGADVKMTFDSTILEVTNVTAGDFFSDEAHNIGSGTLYVAGYFREQFGTKTGSGRLATLTLKGKKVASSQLTFVCTPQNNDTNILDSAANDIVNCTAMKNGNYAFGQGSSSTTPTAAPTNSLTQTATPTPPVTGVSLPTVFSLGAGVLLTILGVAFIF